MVTGVCENQFAAARKSVANWPTWLQKLIVKAKP